MGSNTWDGTYFVFFQPLSNEVAERDLAATATDDGHGATALSSPRFDGEEEGEGEDAASERNATDVFQAPRPSRPAISSDTVKETAIESAPGSLREAENYSNAPRRSCAPTAPILLCEQLLEASRHEELGRSLSSLSSNASSRARKRVRMAAGVALSVIQTPGVVDALVKHGATLGALADAADAHVAAELVSRWGGVKGEEAVCLRVWRRLISHAPSTAPSIAPPTALTSSLRSHTPPLDAVASSDALARASPSADAGTGGTVATKVRERESGHARSSAACWSRALRWAATVGFDGWQAVSAGLLEDVECSGGTTLLLQALRQQYERQDPEDCDGRRAVRGKAARELRLPPGLHAMLTERYGAQYGMGGSCKPSNRSRLGDGRATDVGNPPGPSDAVDELALSSEPNIAQLPLATMDSEPNWVDGAEGVAALHEELLGLADACIKDPAGTQKLRIGVDTEWTDAEAVSGGSADGALATKVGLRGPCVAVVQLAVEGRAWVIDALNAQAAVTLGALLRWMFECDSVITLGFAFQGDLAVLERLCGAEMRVCNLVDLQKSASRRGEDTPSLQRVCGRTIGKRLDKAQQCSEWCRRPLSRAQFLYAALDAHVLLEVHNAVTASGRQSVS